eukprot:scaffold3166_cov399-Prasinococcus_capsulatus_cf.AAC.13
MSRATRAARSLVQTALRRASSSAVAGRVAPAAYNILAQHGAFSQAVAPARFLHSTPSFAASK